MGFHLKDTLAGESFVTRLWVVLGEVMISPPVPCISIKHKAGNYGYYDSVPDPPESLARDTGLLVLICHQLRMCHSTLATEHFWLLRKIPEEGLQRPQTAGVKVVSI